MLHELIAKALLTRAGIFWKAFWALVLGHTISAGIRVIVSREAMGHVLGQRNGEEKQGDLWLLSHEFCEDALAKSPATNRVRAS